MTEFLVQRKHCAAMMWVSFPSYESQRADAHLLLIFPFFFKKKKKSLGSNFFYQNI